MHQHLQFSPRLRPQCPETRNLGGGAGKKTRGRSTTRYPLDKFRSLSTHNTHSVQMVMLASPMDLARNHLARVSEDWQLFLVLTFLLAPPVTFLVTSLTSYHQSKSARAGREPPLEPYWIPFLGSWVTFPVRKQAWFRLARYVKCPQKGQTARRVLPCHVDWADAWNWMGRAGRRSARPSPSRWGR